MVSRKEQKEQTRQAIIESAADMFREYGISGAGVSDIMKEAGLTHGGFYSHFDSKEELIGESLGYAFKERRNHWFRKLEGTDKMTWLKKVISRYLRGDHRDKPHEGCAMAALGAEVGREGEMAKEIVEEHVRETMTALAQRMPGPRPIRGKCAVGAGDRAVALYALMIGGLMLSRNVNSRRLSDRVLRSCREMAYREIEREEI
ncbi:MAG: TetR/AcrR family transcriptional regulator [Alphaproteobacteria bacterium]|nr:TetR/AcrR family transcriptional regulator [Rhodospirillales bacterium]MCW9044695.1 TetR/AcrR family transcriptional regulator [Alphaproteobacteria bacterium]